MKRILALILCALTLTLPMASCSGAKTETAGTQSTASGEAETESDEAETTAERLPRLDFEGGKFVILDSNPRWSGMFEMIDMYADAENGEPINDAVYRRNMRVEDRYNIKIAENKSDDVYGDAQNTTLAGDYVYDMVWPFKVEGVQLVQAGLFADLGKMQYFDFSQSWWDQNVLSELAVAGRVFLMTGEITTMDDDNTTTLVFNKNITANLGLDEPYSLVSDYKWTWDAMGEMSKKAYADLDGDGKASDGDRYGLLTQYYDSALLMTALGVKFVTINDGKMELTYMSERTLSVADKLLSLTNDVSTLFRQKINADDKFLEGLRRFSSDLVLFYVSEPIDFPNFRDMESDWGLLPMPMYDEAQARYYLGLDVGPMLFGIPTTVPDTDRASIIIESMAEYSVDTLTPAYYDIVLARKYSRDDQSEAMLEIIKDSRSYDLGSIYRWSGITDLMANCLISGKNTLASAYEKVQDKITAEMQETYDTLVSIGG